MNKAVLSIFLISFVVGIGQAQDEYRAQYNYDNAGNQTNRNWVCINCQGSSREVPTDTVDVVETDLQDDVLDDLLDSTTPEEVGTIDAYPNPVTSVLQVEWVENQKMVSNIALYSMSGRQLFQRSVQQKAGNLDLDFSIYPPGRYIISVEYNDSSRKAFHILKK